MKTAVWILIGCSTVMAQQQKTKTVKAAPAVPDYTAAIDVLASDGPATNKPQTAVMPGQGTAEVAVPKGWKPKAAAAVPLTGIEAAVVGSNWLSDVNVPAPGKDGRVIFTYGSSLPVVPCRPLSLTVVELEPGERITAAPMAGDSVRWNILPAVSGVEPNQIPMLVIKPIQAGLSTDLVISTDRRLYYLELVSTPDKYVARVAFSYPDTVAAEWKAHQAREDRERAATAADQSARAAASEPVVSIESLNTDYEFRGKDTALRPAWMGDNGSKTYIKMNPSTGPRELPVLMVRGAAGKDEIVNFRVVGDLYVVDRLIDDAYLAIGVGKHARRVELVRTVRKAAVK